LATGSFGLSNLCCPASSGSSNTTSLARILRTQTAPRNK
jgi:hypothetical protein